MEMSKIIKINNVEELWEFVPYCNSHHIPYHVSEKLIFDAVKNNILKDIMCDDVINSLEHMLAHYNDGVLPYKKYIEDVLMDYYEFQKYRVWCKIEAERMAKEIFTYDFYIYIKKGGKNPKEEFEKLAKNFEKRFLTKKYTYRTNE